MAAGPLRTLTAPYSFEEPRGAELERSAPRSWSALGGHRAIVRYGADTWIGGECLQFRGGNVCCKSRSYLEAAEAPVEALAGCGAGAAEMLSDDGVLL